eukprot:TCONS_00073217-protein
MHKLFILLILIAIATSLVEGRRPRIPRRKRQHHDHNYKPSFIKSPLILERHENTKEGFLLDDISQYAKDDEGDQLLYKLDVAGEEICTIGLTDGKLRLKIRPDREQKEEYRFQVIVSDSFEGGYDREAFLDVYLYILDENDNKPIFKNTPYHVDVSEATSIGKTLIRIFASDKDAGRNKDIRYVFRNKNGEDPEEFELVPNTGELKLRAPLDYEKQTSYTLEVMAMDSGSPALSEQTKIVINVIDVDDMKPFFVLHQHNKEIRENQPIGSRVAIVSARDGDKGINAEINYAIVAGDEYGLFKIDRKTGNVTVKGVLDREYYPKFTLQIEAYEADNVNSYARINLNIKLKDENDNRPKFENDHYSFELDEDKNEISPDRIISRDIKAYDDDVTWKNNFITYWMDENEYFEILSEAGTLIQKGDLRRQDKDHFKFFVYATERETSERYTDKTEIDIHLNRSKRRPKVINGYGEISGASGGGTYSNARRDYVNKYLFTVVLFLCTLLALRTQL